MHYPFETRDDKGRRIGLKVITWEEGGSFFCLQQATRNEESYGPCRRSKQCASAAERDAAVAKAVSSTRIRYARKFAHLASKVG